MSVYYDAIAVDDILHNHKYLTKTHDIVQVKCLHLLKNVLIAMTFFTCSALKCVSMSNQECKIRPEAININSNEPLLYPYSVLVNKCRGSCNDINNPYAKLCVPDVAKTMNVKVFNILSRINETRYVSWHETCTCKRRLDAGVCNNKKSWNNDTCRCECKELIDNGRCNNEFIGILVDVNVNVTNHVT